MKKGISCLIFLVFSLYSMAQEKWDLRQCVEYALSHNISIKRQDINERFSKLTYEQNKLGKYPDLNFGSNLGLSTGRSIDRTTNQFTNETIFYNTFSLQSGVDVFNFFSKKNTIESSRFELEASKALGEKVKNDIALTVALNYLQVLLAREQANIARLQMQRTESQLENTRKLVKAGSLPELNAAQLEAQLAQDSSNVVTAKSNEQLALYNLKAVLALDVDVPFDIATPPVALIPVESLADLQPAAVYQTALQNLPQQKFTANKLKAAEKNVAAAKGLMYPSVSASGALQTNYSNSKNRAELLGTSIIGSKPVGFVRPTNDTVFAWNVVPNYRFYATPYSNQLNDNLSKGIGLNISVPIFNGGRARTNWQKAKLTVEDFRLQQSADSLTLKQDIYKAYTDAVIAMEKFNATKKAVETAEKAYGYATRRFNAGLLSTLEYVTSQSNLFSARLAMTSAQFEYVFRLKLLEFYKGQGLKL